MARHLAACVVGFLALSGGFAAAGEEHGLAQRIVGTWLVRVEWPGFPPFQYLHHVLPDGKTTLLLPFGVPPCAQGSSPTCGTPADWQDTRVGCLGDWTQRSSSRFDMTLYCLPHQGDGYVPDRIRLRATVAHNLKTYNADGFTYEWFNADGSLLFGGQGKMSGKRLAHTPLP